MLTFYTNRFIPSRFAGFCVGPVILIRPEYREDRGLLEHEKTHRRQWLKTLGLQGIFYDLSADYQLRCEAEAYAKQIEFSGIGRLDLFSYFIATKYGLDVTEDEARQAIVSFLPEPLRAGL